MQFKLIAFILLIGIVLADQDQQGPRDHGDQGMHQMDQQYWDKRHQQKEQEDDFRRDIHDLVLKVAQDARKIKRELNHNNHYGATQTANHITQLEEQIESKYQQLTNLLKQKAQDSKKFLKSKIQWIKSEYDAKKRQNQDVTYLLDMYKGFTRMYIHDKARAARMELRRTIYEAHKNVEQTAFANYEGEEAENGGHSTHAQQVLQTFDQKMNEVRETFNNQVKQLKDQIKSSTDIKEDIDDQMKQHVEQYKSQGVDKVEKAKNDAKKQIQQGGN